MGTFNRSCRRAADSQTNVGTKSSQPVQRNCPLGWCGAPDAFGGDNGFMGARNRPFPAPLNVDNAAALFAPLKGERDRRQPQPLGITLPPHALLLNLFALRRLRRAALTMASSP